MSKSELIIQSIMVKKPKDSLFSENATTVEMEDEGGGAFVIVSQPGRENTFGRSNTFAFDIEEWPQIRNAIEQMVSNCERYNEQIGNNYDAYR